MLVDAGLPLDMVDAGLASSPRFHEEPHRGCQHCSGWKSLTAGVYHMPERDPMPYADYQGGAYSDDHNVFSIKKPVRYFSPSRSLCP